MKILILGLSLLCAVSAQAQRYTRNSVSIIHTSYNDKYDKMVDQYFDSYQPGARYDNNTIATKEIVLNASRDLYKEIDNKRNYLVPNWENTLSRYTNNIGKEILSYLFSYDKKGHMDFYLLGERGLYNANDDDAILASAAKSGNALLRDAGANLLNNSYFIIYDMANIRYEYHTDLGDEKGEYYWLCTPVAYLYRIKWDDNMKNTFYESYWINEDDAPAEKECKATLYKSLEVPVELIMKVSKSSISKSTKVEKNKRENSKQSEETLINNAFRSMMNSATSDLEEEMEKKHSSFQLSNAIFETHPIRVKIGKKEGISSNNRFFVYETISKDGTATNTKEVRKGVVLASKQIADNRTNASGQTPSTVFYQIAGRKLAEGMTIREKKWIGMGLEAGYRYGENQGVYVGATMSFIGGKVTNNTVLLNATIDNDAFNVALGYGYGLRINNFELYPYIGAGLDTFSKDKEDDDTKLSKEEEDKESMKRSAWYALGGIRMNLNIYHPVQLFAGCEFDYRVWDGAEYNYYRVTKDRNIDGFNVYGGIRVCF